MVYVRGIMNHVPKVAAHVITPVFSQPRMPPRPCLPVPLGNCVHVATEDIGLSPRPCQAERRVGQPCRTTRSLLCDNERQAQEDGVALGIGKQVACSLAP